MATRKLGYNILFQIDNGDGTYKLFGGTTENTFDLSAKTKESIAKEDKGTSSTVITGYDHAYSVKGLVEINEVGEEGDRMDQSAIIDLILNSTVVDVAYGGSETGDAIYKGKAICEKYSESTNSEDEATYDASFKGNGKLTKSTRA